LPDDLSLAKVGPIIMKIAFLITGKTSPGYLAEGISIFGERLKKYLKFEIITIPDLKRSRNISEYEQKSMEGKRIIAQFRKDDYIVVLDVGGTGLSTAEFASWLEKGLMLQKKRMLFVIGGAWGFSEEVLKIADKRISLSRMTFSHQMVRLLFLEQLYRAFTIIKGEPYHH
jgi:23S rRNA (pseudouridine1915-N3)-methyltransferase